MATVPTPDRLRSVLEQAASGLGLEIEDVNVAPTGRRRLLRLVVDKDGGVTLDELAEANRSFSRALDDADAMGEQAYTLEVTSPGLERPLTAPRHWRRNVGRLVKVVDSDGGTTVGRIADCDDSQARLDVDGTERIVRYTDVAKARVEVEFNRKDG